MNCFIYSLIIMQLLNKLTNLIMTNAVLFDRSLSVHELLRE